MIKNHLPMEHCHGESCGCEHPTEHKRMGDTMGLTKHIFLLENLDCANCAAKIEEKIAQLPGVQDARIVFSTKQLHLYAEKAQEKLQEIQKVCTSVEPEVKVSYKSSTQPSVKKEKEEKQRTLTKELREEKRALLEIFTGTVFFAVGIFLEKYGFGAGVLFPIFFLSYLILGGKVVFKALKNIGRGQIFDENFLMSAATLGAFAIKEFPEAAGVMLFYRIGEYFEERAVRKSRGQILEAIDMRPEVVNRLKEGEVETVPAEEAMAGDLLLVRPGDRIPLDGVVTEGESRIDTSPITGEPVPVKAGVGAKVLSGCVNLSGQMILQVEKPLEESMVTRILNSVENAAASKPQMEHFITKFARIYTPAVVGIALATAILPSLYTGDWNYWTYTALSFLVMSCPCALVLSVPLAFFSGIGAGSKKGILFKGGLALESLSTVRAVVMDKTGTVTKGNFTLQKIEAKDGMTEEELLTICAGCEKNSTHPIAVSIVEEAQKRGIAPESPSELLEIAGHGIAAELSGRQILCGNKKLLEKYHVLWEEEEKQYGAEVLVAVDGRYQGRLVISDTIKENAKEAVSSMKKQHIKTIMLTGDAQSSAEEVAQRTGIEEVHAKLLPEDKWSELQNIRQEYGTVMFVGDGINDAPVLAGADVGAAMGSGADAAIEAADVVFMTSDMTAIVQAIQIAKASSRISRQNVWFALVVKFVVVLLGFMGYASMWTAVFADTGVAMICVMNSIRISWDLNPTFMLILGRVNKSCLHLLASMR